MKKITNLLAICIVLSNALFAQITITTADMPSADDTIRYTSVNPMAVDVTITGANYNWVFDTVATISQGVYNYKNALQTPYAFYFLGLNKYGLKTADTIGVGAFSFTDVYSFYKKSNGKFEAEGTGMTYTGIPLAAYYGDNDEIYTFPLNYSDRDSTTFDYTIQVPGVLDYIQKGYRINTVDGWGTIKTPFGTANCLRLVSDIISKDSIALNGFGFAFPNNTRTIKWLTNTDKIPYFEVSGSVLANNFTPTRARYRGVNLMPNSISENMNNTNSIISPNPANDLLFVSTKTIGENIAIYNSVSQLVLNVKSNQLKIRIDGSHLPNGVYFVKMQNQAHKIVVQH